MRTTPDRTVPPVASTDGRWLCLPAVPESSSRCRDFVRSTFEPWGVDGLDDALLLVSELCSNVIRHAGTPMVLGIVLNPVTGVVRVGMRDYAAGLPSVRQAGLLSPSGRGLPIIESVAQRWGIQRLPVGKVVWFELRVSDGRAPAAVHGHEARHAAPGAWADLRPAAEPSVRGYEPESIGAASIVVRSTSS